MFQLNTLVSLVKKKKRIGRGGSRGGTSGRGHKGQKARTGGKSKVRRGFEGGQIPLVRRMPKRGFNNAPFKKEYVIINLGDLETIFDNGMVITKELLIARGLCKGVRDPFIKILGHGELSKKFIIHSDAFSENTIAKIKQYGGEVHLVKES